MNTNIKTFLIAVGMAAVFFLADYVFSAWSGDPASFSKVAVILMITFFAYQIANKSGDQPPDKDQSD
ncbi:MAG: hypothetical protein OSB57_14655 [Planctomycetota bacterium]|nr:hypothetical protein [Planctomycetota bacterium]